MEAEVGDDEISISICWDCSTHPSLKRLIEQDCVIGVCGFCTRADVRVRNPENTEPMVMLIRALVRYYWDEWDYNPHWGGDSVLGLFVEGNPVLAPLLSDKYSDEIGFLIEEPPYPDWNTGISVYAGFDDGVRLLNNAISKTTDRGVIDLRARLDENNFAAIAPELNTLIDAFITDLLFTIPKDALWYRARTGVEALYRRYDGFESEVVRQPYMHAAIGASPHPGHGRLNRAGSPALYLGSTPYTALAEIRPHPGHYVSVGGFTVVRPLRVADFDPDISLFSSSDARLALYQIIQTFDRLMSTPVTPDNKKGYLITQLLAEVLSARGIDGVQFKSSVSDGVNLCLFRPEDALFALGHSQVRHVKALTYDAPETTCIDSPGPNDFPVAR